MFRNYLIVAFRTLTKDVRYLVVSMVSLAIGIAVAIIAFLNVYNELNFDRFSNADLIYRVGCSTLMQNTLTEWAPAPAPLAETLTDVFSEVEEVTRFSKMFEDQSGGVLIEYEDKKFQETQFLIADSGFFKVFSYKFLYGSAMALHQPDKIVLNSGTYRKLFNDSDPIGEIITLGDNELEVAGVVDTDGFNSHLEFNGLISWSSFNMPEPWTDAYAYTYVLFNASTNMENVKSRIPEFVEQRIDPYVEVLEAEVDLILQPVQSIHLRSHLNAEINSNGNIYYVYLFAILGLFFIIIAVTNYINIMLARSQRRAREIGIRKVMGAHKVQIKAQIFIESIFLTFISTVLALLLAVLILPYFNNLINEQIPINLLVTPGFIISMITLVIVVGIISGSYPAIYTARLNTVKILKGISTGKERVLSLRKALVLIQFAVSIAMIIATVIVGRQLRFVNDKDVGFNKDNVLVIHTPPDFTESLKVIKNDVLSESSIQSAALSSFDLKTVDKDEYRIEYSDGNKINVVQQIFTDYDFLDLMNMRVVEGRNFDENIPSDLNNAYIVNEEAARIFGWGQPIGKKISAVHGVKKGVVIGVVKNVHLHSLHQKIQPLIIQLAPPLADHLSLYCRVGQGQLNSAMEIVRTRYRDFTSYDVKMQVLSDEYTKQYKSEKDLSLIISMGAIFIVVIACAGLFGLSSIMAEQRKKEVSVRIVLGANPVEIIQWYLKSFISLALIANLIAWPLSYFLLDKWLENFSYKINFGWMLFLFAGVLTVLIVFLTTFFHAARMAKVSPAQTLRQS